MMDTDYAAAEARVLAFIGSMPPTRPTAWETPVLGELPVTPSQYKSINLWHWYGGRPGKCLKTLARKHGH